MDIESLIARRHGGGETTEGSQWLVIYELANGTGHKKTGAIDVAVLNCWPSTGYHRIAYEVKRSRSDFLSELKDPAKHKWVQDNFHETYFAFSSADIGTVEEIPEGWGLVVQSKKGDTLRATKVARQREIGPMSESLCFAVMRSAVEQMNRMSLRTFRVDQTEYTATEFAELVTKRVYNQAEYARKNMEKATEEYRKAQHKVVEARQKFIAPLAVLYNLAYGGGSHNLDWMSPEQFTGEAIQSMIDKAVARKVGAAVHHIRSAGREIEGILKTIDIPKEGF